MPKRCGWVKMNNPLYVAYHDEEWGQPLHDDRALFELLCLETYQSGLSWETVLNKRQAFREVFYGYQIQAVAEMTDNELEEAMEAMLALGYKATELKKIKKFFEGTTDTAENYIKSALKMLVK